jgi:hypothetical protein
MAANQRLLFFPIALQVGGALLVLPVTLASHDVVTFDVYARDAANADQRTVDLLEASSTSTTTFVAMGAAFVVAVLLTAWLTGAFIRSIGDGALRWWPGTRAFVRLAVLYLVTAVAGLGLLAVSDSDDYGGLALLLVLLISIPLTFADYAVVLEDRSLPAAIVRSCRIWRRRPGQALMTLVIFILASNIVFELFISKLDESEGVFPGFLGALLLVQALVAYASDCLLIALLLETPDDAEALTAPEPATPE